MEANCAVAVQLLDLLLDAVGQVDTLTAATEEDREGSVEKEPALSVRGVLVVLERIGNEAVAASVPNPAVTNHPLTSEPLDAADCGGPLKTRNAIVVAHGAQELGLGGSVERSAAVYGRRRLRVHALRHPVYLV